MMRERSDPLVPLLATAVSLVLVGAIFFVFYPRLSRWLGPSKASVVGEAPEPDDAVPVWVCRDVPGVALLLRGGVEESGLAEAFDAGPYRLLTLHAYNFARDEPLDIELPEGGFASPEGGEPLRPASRLVRADAPPRLRPILLGLGAVNGLRVPKGHAARLLLALRDDPAKRTAFVSGTLTFERRELKRQALARFEQRPTPKEFEEFR
jgi:hypothetical protein